MTTIQKTIVAGLLFLAWGALVLMGQAPVGDFVTAIRDALIALGVFHMSTPNDPPSPPPVSA